jgi:AraC-like DNA-binding protein
LFRTAEQFLLRQFVRPLALHTAVNSARKGFSIHFDVSMASVANNIGLSQRRFIELFRRQIGLTPKAFCRVQRFQRVLNRVHRARDIDWIQVALNCGYYDQAHFIHDFRELSGMTPTQYVTRVTEHQNHVSVVLVDGSIFYNPPPFSSLQNLH